jgi:hypothetical protein
MCSCVTIQHHAAADRVLYHGLKDLEGLGIGMKIVFKKNDKIYGPYEHTQVEQFIRERRLLPQDPCAIVGTEVGQPLSVLLQNIAATTPSNPQPPMRVPPHH